MSRAVPFVLLLITLAIVLGARIAGPSDIHDKSQPKTVAYTADMVLHGHYILPRDMVGGPARKPPMYNWIGVPFVVLFGFAEPVLKMPAMLSGVVTLALIVYATRRMLRSAELGFDGDAVRATAWLAGIIWLASYPTFSLIYVARPDMPLVAFLTAAWALATILLTRKDEVSSGGTPKPQEESRKCKDWQVALAFWLCVAGAALSKGPPALLPIIYVLVAVKPISGRWATLQRFHFEWGVPLFVALFGFWVFGAWRTNPQHFWGVLVGEEVTGRFSDGEPLDPYRVHKPFWLIFTWFILKFAPWSILTGLVLLLVPPRRWFHHPVTPAMAWLAVVLVFFAIPEGKRQDYLAPAYPAASALAAYVTLMLLRRINLERAGVRWAGLAGVALVIVYTDYQWRRSPEALEHSGDNVKAFARDVRKHVRRDERIVFTELGFHPLQTLMGIHETDPLPPDALSLNGWLIAPVADLPGVRAVAVSRDIPQIKQIKDAPSQIHERRSGVLGLYRLPLERPSEAATTQTASDGAN
jgi:4-amino-4-deoxy-L-arabinose transferase-like glycosyltransferase